MQSCKLVNLLNLNLLTQKLFAKFLEFFYVTLIEELFEKNVLLYCLWLKTVIKESFELVCARIHILVSEFLHLLRFLDARHQHIWIFDDQVLVNVIEVLVFSNNVLNNISCNLDLEAEISVALKKTFFVLHLGIGDIARTFFVCEHASELLLEIVLFRLLRRSKLHHSLFEQIKITLGKMVVSNHWLMYVYFVKLFPWNLKSTLRDYCALRLSRLVLSMNCLSNIDVLVIYHMDIGI